MKLSNKGFTLIEIIVVMAVFIVIIMITGDAFKTILTHTGRLSKSEESNIEGVIGLEMMRHDLEQAGFGLPYSYDSTTPITYLEAGYLPANGYNDAPSGVPRAFVAGNNLAATADPNSYTGGIKYNVIANTDYLSIKASSVGSSEAAQKWTYINYSSSGKAPKSWPGGNLKSTSPADRVIMLRRSFANGVYTNQLLYDVNTPGIYWVNHSNSGYVAAFSPATPEETIFEYGIRSCSSTTCPVGMPFNRVDYFVSKPTLADKLPSTCEPNNTGVLYKATINHSTTNPGGTLNYMPVLDCVADMQVIFGWDLPGAENSSVTVDSSNVNNTGDGIIDTWSNADGSVVSGSGTIAQVQAAMANAGHVRTKLKIIKVLILAQDGKKDPAYTSPSLIPVGTQKGEDDGGSTATTTLYKPGGFAISSAMLNYRWKVYKLIIKPKNLISNQ
ncbi:MAG TPA: prepilin-type N-terminal cleavage/methylation domain-containing protein [Desulfuromonadales bacterium]|nr:prepilin-type N-terminal cleavage/methylation domain-containing protein [Desulfuromonadales bacterium]